MNTPSAPRAYVWARRPTDTSSARPGFTMADRKRRSAKAKKPRPAGVRQPPPAAPSRQGTRPAEHNKPTSRLRSRVAVMAPAPAAELAPADTAAFDPDA